MLEIQKYKGLLSNQDEEAVETTVNPDMWPVNPKAFELRKNKWNYE